MSAFQLNKILMAVLGTIFIAMALNFLAAAIYHPHAPEEKGYTIQVAEAGGESNAPAEAAGPAYDPIDSMLASADLGAGEKVFKKCAACHTFDKGGANKVGPNLYGLVNRPAASVADFKYSSAMTEFGASGKTWTYEELNGYLFKPKEHVPGNSMGFAGLKKTDDRANLIGWLRTHADSPAPLPGS